MARRPRKVKDLTQVGAGNLSHAPKNELSDDQRHALTLQHKNKYVAALATKKAAAKDFLDATKVIKADLGDNGLADIKDMIAADGDGFEERLQAELERQARVARWLGLDLGAQGNLFEQRSSLSQQEKGFAEGKRAGLANEVCKPPFDAGTDGYDGYMRGWHEGNAVYTTTTKEQRDGEVLLMRPAGNEPAGADAFDKAAEGSAGASTVKWPDEEKLGERQAQVDPVQA